jgi:stalled ribosome rescue protein Dom34
MSTFHAVVWMDQQQAHVLQFDAESVHAQRVKARSHHTSARHPDHHGGGERELKAYFDDVVAALTGAQEVLLVGPGSAHEAFKHWCNSHHAALAKTIVGSEKADHPTDPQLVALARKYFVAFDRMAGTPTPMGT